MGPDHLVRLPADDHVHSQFSWDAFDGDMVATCARAVALGLPAVSFTEHVDLTAWLPPQGGWAWPEGVRGSTDAHGRFLGAPLEVDAYLGEVERCRERFPDLRIRCGIELSEGHWYPGAVRDLLRRGFDRVVGSVPWEVLEEPVRHALALLAASGRALEVNTSLPLDLRVVRWWHEAGGQAVSFGSDAHSPGDLAQRFGDVAAAVTACGFGPADDPTPLWCRA